MMVDRAATIEDVLGFWLEPKPATEEATLARMRTWFNGGPAIDQEITVRFASLVERARRGELDAWTQTFRGTLALLILLDQFMRNIYRGAPTAYSADAKALAIANEGFACGAFDAADSLELMFLALPLTHAEDLDAQRRALVIAQRAVLFCAPAWRKSLTTAVDYARKHLDVIARFGRFPHRNPVLGRASTRDETEYLQYLRAVGQWL
jgi:uncharacterized protein (DUF924 family)